MKNFFNSIQWKLIVIYVLLTLIAMQIIGLYFVRATEEYYMDNFESTLETQAGLLSVNLERYLSEDIANVKEINLLVNNLFALSGVDASIMDRNGLVISTTEQRSANIIGKRISQTEVNSALLGIRSEAIRVNTGNGERTKYLAVPVKQGGNVIGVVFLQASVESVYETIDKINIILFSAILIALIATVILGYLLSRTITKPIKEIKEQAENITHGDYKQEVTIYGDDEIGELGKTFNLMAIKLSDAMHELNEEKEKLASILSNMSDGVIALDKDERIILINQRATELLNIEEEELLSQKIGDILGEAFLPEHQETLTYRYTQDGQERILKLTNNRLDFEDERTGVIIVIYDVTKEQQHEQTRKDFVANVSHELRTPLTTIKSYIEALDDGAIKDEKIATNFIKVANQETDRMVRLVNDLLLLSRIEGDALEVNRTFISISTLIEDVIDRFNMKLQEKNINCTYLAEESLPDVFVDTDKIDQVLNNLIYNAIKYTNHGGKIQISSYLKENRIYVEVADNGVGIPEEDLSRLFERFYRVDKARSRELGGTGLGLPISREIIKAHQGGISVESELGKGTKFVFYLPLLEEAKKNERKS